MVRLVAIAFLITACVLWWRLASSLSRVHETAIGGLPCVVRAETEYESYMTVTHPGWCGLTIRYVAVENPPDIVFSVSTVPQNDPLVSGTFTTGMTQASAQFRALWLPPQSTIRMTISLRGGDEDLLLDCREFQREGRIGERVVVETHHRYGRTARENVLNWLTARVAPFAPPGLGGTHLLLLLVAPVGGALLLLLSLCGQCGGPTDRIEPR
jgi:hypothetical protein